MRRHGSFGVTISEARHQAAECPVTAVGEEGDGEPEAIWPMGAESNRAVQRMQVADRVRSYTSATGLDARVWICRAVDGALPRLRSR